MDSAQKLRIGTRGSPLARWQANWVAAQLQQLGHEVELVPIKTTGDVTSGPLGQIGGQGLFTKELQRALLDGRIDLAVHSLKDLPTAPITGLTIAAVPKRESVHDVLVTTIAQTVAELPAKARLGTGSLRRKAQLLHQRPDLDVRDIRGNVESRLQKLDDGQFDAIVLAEAGLTRLGLAGRIRQVLPTNAMLPAIGQGALGIETRNVDARVRQALHPLDDAETHKAVIAERTLLFALRAGCLAPVGAHARPEGGMLALDAVVLCPEGRQRLTARGTAAWAEAAALGQRVADDLLGQGADQLIDSARGG